MSEAPKVPALVENMIRTVTSRTGSTDAERDERASTFARGLALGALVGAAIAGSTIWQRRLARRSSRPADQEPTVTP